MANWIPLIEYAMKKGVSLSTLRRYIKADKVRYRIEGGRYLLLDEEPPVDLQRDSVPMSTDSDLQKAREEIAELKTLIAFYEEQLSGPRIGI